MSVQSNYLQPISVHFQLHTIYISALSITYSLYQCTLNYMQPISVQSNYIQPISVHFKLHTAHISAFSITYSLYQCSPITYSLYQCIFNPLVHYSFQRRLSKLFRIAAFLKCIRPRSRRSNGRLRVLLYFVCGRKYKSFPVQK